MARPPSRTRREPPPREVSAPPAPPGSGPGAAGPFWNRSRTVLAVVLLTAVHLTLAIRSLLRENPTVDEVVHLPAGITYWQKGTFRLYHHNPPLVKLVAALPVVLSDPVMTPLYEAPSWTTEPPSHTAVRAELRLLERAPIFRAVRAGPAADAALLGAGRASSSSPGRAGSTAWAAAC